LIELSGRSVEEFVKGFKSEATKETYKKSLRQFLNDVKVTPDEFLRRTKANPKWMEKQVLEHVEKRKIEVGGSHFRKLLDALKHFAEMNDIDEGINWAKLAKLMPRAKKVSSDRSPTVEEIRRFVDNADLRMKCIVLLCCSSGIRLGAFGYEDRLRKRRFLTWRDIEPVVKDGVTTAAKLTVYCDAPEEYPTFASPEFYAVLLDYKRKREVIGETITADSPVIRDVWDDNKHRKQRNEDPRIARPLSAKAIANEVGRLWLSLGITALGSKHPFKQVHGFRKFFESQALASGVKEVAVEKMKGRLSSYYRPTDEEYLSEYLKAVPRLTISEAAELKDKLEKQVVISDRKVGELERRGLVLEEQLEKMQKDYGELKKMVERRLSPKG